MPFPFSNVSLQIRKKMREVMLKESQACDLKDMVNKFIPESIGKEMEKACNGIYPLQNVYVRKVKILKYPKFDLGKLLEVSSTTCPYSPWPLCMGSSQAVFGPSVALYLPHSAQIDFG